MEGMSPDGGAVGAEGGTNVRGPFRQFQLSGRGENVGGDALSAVRERSLFGQGLRSRGSGQRRSEVSGYGAAGFREPLVDLFRRGSALRS